jgi:hypothetical protein
MLLLTALALGCLHGCTPPDPKAELKVSEIEAFWAIDPDMGGTHYIAPAVKFRVHNIGQQEQRSVQSTVTFRRKGEESQTWGSDWKQVSSAAKPLLAGQDVMVLLKSDARYYSNGNAETMFTHHDFKDARVEVFLRLGASGWVKFGEIDVERRFGARSVLSPATPEK